MNIYILYGLLLLLCDSFRNPLYTTDSLRHVAYSCSVVHECIIYIYLLSSHFFFLIFLILSYRPRPDPFGRDGFRLITSKIETLRIKPHTTANHVYDASESEPHAHRFQPSKRFSMSQIDIHLLIFFFFFWYDCGRHSNARVLHLSSVV